MAPGLSFTQTQHLPPRPNQQLSPPVDLPQLHRDIEDLIREAHAASASNPYDQAVVGRLTALTSLQAILHQQYHPPEQLQQVRDQVSQLRDSSRSAQPHVAPGAMASLSQYVNAHAQQLPELAGNSKANPQPSTPSPADVHALMSSKNLANIISNAQRSSATPSIAQENSVLGTTDSGASTLLASLRKAGMLNVTPGNPSQTSIFGTPPLTTPAPPQIASLVNDVKLTSASLKR